MGAKDDRLGGGVEVMYLSLRSATPRLSVFMKMSGLCCTVNFFMQVTYYF